MEQLSQFDVKGYMSFNDLGIFLFKEINMFIFGT